MTGLSKVTFDWTFTPFEVIVLGNFTLDGIVTGLLRGRTACTITAPEVTNARGCNRSDQSPRLAANLLRFSCNLLRCVRMRSVYTAVKES